MEQSPLALHHVGVAVPSIDDAMHFYGDKLGLDLVDTVDMPERQLKVAFVKTANTLIELLEPTDPDSTVSRFLERRGPGLHHLCFGTPDIREHLRDLRDKGVELIDEAPRPGAHGEVAFLQPAAALGVLVELLQPTLADRDGAETDARMEATTSGGPLPEGSTGSPQETSTSVGPPPQGTAQSPGETGSAEGPASEGNTRAP
jgi:methylmalonyl-CoA/ethylmalonyl-CoA epimerase